MAVAAEHGGKSDEDDEKKAKKEEVFNDIHCCSIEKEPGIIAKKLPFVNQKMVKKLLIFAKKSVYNSKPRRCLTRVILALARVAA